jgi:superfamily II DNA helicase RecQ
MDEFLADKKIWSVIDHFFLLHDKEPTWLFAVQYEEISDEDRYSPRNRGLAPASAKLLSEKAIVEEKDRDRYEALRKWRNERAKQVGTPPYILFSNKQLALIAEKRPDTQAALLGIEGIGEARAHAYGKEILEILRGLEGGAHGS